jgi:hypothetical protein
MKCMFVVKFDVVSGFPIVWDYRRPYVPFGDGKIYLSNDLLETNPGQRLLRCDVFAEGDHVEFIAERESTVSGAVEPMLYLAAAGDCYKMPKVKIRDADSGPTRSTLVKTRLFFPKVLGSNGAAYVSILGMLYPGAAITTTASRRQPNPQIGGWRRLLGLDFKVVQEVVDVVRRPD